MNYYAGLDVSLEETAICVVDGSGLIVKEVRAASEPEALIAALKAIDVPLERIGLEACSLTAWLHDGLRGPAGDLHRDAAGERCDEDDAEQDRSQRRAGACSDHADGLV
jgi:transposase